MAESVDAPDSKSGEVAPRESSSLSPGTKGRSWIQGMNLRFSKMQALGNDFVVLDALSTPLALFPEDARFLANRRLGVGADQVLVAEPSSHADAFYRIFNADGSESGQCGNGARCLARFLWERGLVRANPMTLCTLTTEIAARRQDGGIEVLMPAPMLSPQEIPFLAKEALAWHRIEVPGGGIEASVLSLGNPHAVLRVKDIHGAPVETLGPQLSTHPLFPEGANVGFLSPLTPHRIALRVWERGAGETMACGSGATAAAWVAMREGWARSPVTVALPGGELEVSEENGRLWLRGPAAWVFDGVIEIKR